ncbi:MAG: STAS domain-containing protein [Actinomycetia bacterium]|nr:STAS domain-containing protein [Actinomycetes bacterium]
MSQSWATVRGDLFGGITSNKMVGTLSVDIQEHEVVILDCSETDYVDDSAALVVGQLIDVAIAEDTECVVMGVEGPVADSLQSLDVLRRVPPDHFVADMDEARAVSSQLLGFDLARSGAGMS